MPAMDEVAFIAHLKDMSISMHPAVVLMVPKGQKRGPAATASEATAAYINKPVRRSELVLLVRKHPFDLVLMDIQMPVMDGLDATSIIRSREKSSGKHLPIVAMTAHAMREHRTLCLEAGMDGYISKPIRIEELFNAIKQIKGRNKPDPERTRRANKPAKKEKRPSSFLDKALELLGGDFDLAIEAVRLFLEDYPAHLEVMRKAISDDDPGELAKAAHKFKGSAANFLIPHIN